MFLRSHKTWVRDLLEMPRRMVNADDQKWKILMSKNLDKVGGLDYLLTCNFDLKKLAIYFSLNSFCDEILNIYANLHSYELNGISTQEDIRVQVINNNQNILVA